MRGQVENQIEFNLFSHGNFVVKGRGKRGTELVERNVSLVWFCLN